MPGVRRSRAGGRRSPLRTGLVGVLAGLLAVSVLPLATSSTARADQKHPEAPPAPSTGARSRGAWDHLTDRPAARHEGRAAVVHARSLRAFTLDRDAMGAALAQAPAEAARGRAADDAAPITVSVPRPEGGFARFALVESSVMEPGLAARHPEIRTYSGTGLDDPRASIAADLTPLGFHAAVRTPSGSWYVDPLYAHSQDVYATYYGRDLTRSPHGTFVERDGSGLAAAARVLGADAPQADAPAGPAVQLRTYRLALVTDPTYAAFFPGQVAAAKVTLINRVDQIYASESAIKLVLIDGTDVLNLDTDAKATGTNGPCGSAACYTTSQLASCGSSTLQRTRIVLGQLVGASAYDIGHLGLGVDGGGIASLGVVGGNLKGQGCTGLPAPVGDFYAVDYVAHEMGHQFGANHTFNGTGGSCFGGNRNPGTSVEPGSGSSIMAYAGICGQDDLQPHTDPYWSQRSYAEISSYVSTPRGLLNEVQNVSLRDFDGTDSFTLTFDGKTTAPIVRGTSYSIAGIAAALTAAGIPAAVGSWGGASAASFGDTGFQITFNSPVQYGATDVDPVRLTDLNGVTGFVGETAKGGAQDNGGAVSSTTDHAPVVAVPAEHTIPLRTPFTLTGSATDEDGDPLSYLWEQNDVGTVGTALVDNVKTDGPLFRVFGTAAHVTDEETVRYDSLGENHTTGDPARTFPDLAQILAENTNAKTGTCPAAPADPTPVPDDVVDCYSEFLPTAGYLGPMHFRLTARDGRPDGGGIGSADTTVHLAPGTGPFLVTSQEGAETVSARSRQAVTWDVAGTDAAPVDAADVRITMSDDGGQTFPYVLAASVPNTGSAVVPIANVATTRARIKVEAVGNVFFDISDADFTVVDAAPDVTTSAPSGGAEVQYSDALTPVTVTATDADSDGSALVAAVTGLSPGLSMRLTSTSAVGARPGSRTWTIAGTTKAKPATYPVTVQVSDEGHRVGANTFDVVVTQEDADVVYTGDTVARRGNGSRALLRATVRDRADGKPGDVRKATVTFTTGSTTLCGPVKVSLLGGAPTLGTAACSARVPAGTRTVTAVVGGYYTGSASGRLTLI